MIVGTAGHIDHGKSALVQALTGRAMDRLADQMDQVMARMEAADKANNAYHGCGPRLNEPKDPSAWLSPDHAPWAKLENEKPQGETIAYDELIKRWTNNQ